MPTHWLFLQNERGPQSVPSGASVQSELSCAELWLTKSPHIIVQISNAMALNDNSFHPIIMILFLIKKMNKFPCTASK
jgi:hypothetical protein